MFIHLENAYVSVLPTNGEVGGYVNLILFVRSERKFAAVVKDDMKVIKKWAVENARKFGA